MKVFISACVINMTNYAGLMDRRTWNPAGANPIMI